MKVIDLKNLVADRFTEEDDECEVVVMVNGNAMEITGITDHGFYTKPGGLPFEINIR